MLDCCAMLLPGIDADGPADGMSSLIGCAALQAAGITAVITACRSGDRDDPAIGCAFHDIATGIAQGQLGLIPYFGRITDLDQDPRGPIERVANTPIVLVLCRQLGQLQFDRLQELINEGMRPILLGAQDCRVDDGHRRQLVADGCLLQIDLGSILNGDRQSHDLLHDYGIQAIIASRVGRPEDLRRWAELPAELLPHVPSDLSQLVLRADRSPLFDLPGGAVGTPPTVPTVAPELSGMTLTPTTTQGHSNLAERMRTPPTVLAGEQEETRAVTRLWNRPAADDWDQPDSGTEAIIRRSDADPTVLAAARELAGEAASAAAEGNTELAIEGLSAAIDRLGDTGPRFSARLLRRRAAHYAESHDLHKAIADYRSSRDRCQVGNDSLGEARSHYELGALFTRSGQWALAREALHSGLGLVDDQQELQLRFLSLLGRVERKLGLHDDAVTTMRRALPLAEHLDDVDEQFRLRSYLGRLHAARDEHHSQEQLLRETITLATRLDRRVDLLENHYLLGRLLARDPDKRREAATSLTLAIDGYRHLGTTKAKLPDSLPRMHQVLAGVLLATDQQVAALTHYEHALNHQRRIDEASTRGRKSVARSLLGLGSTYIALGDHASAKRHLDEATGIALALDDQTLLQLIEGARRG